MSLFYPIISFFLASVMAKSHDDYIVSFIFRIILIGFNAIEDQMIPSKLTHFKKKKGNSFFSTGEPHSKGRYLRLKQVTQ